MTAVAVVLAVWGAVAVLTALGLCLVAASLAGTPDPDDECRHRNCADGCDCHWLDDQPVDVLSKQEVDARLEEIDRLNGFTASYRNRGWWVQ